MQKKQFYKGKKVLVTAGPTWTPVDRVRVFTSIFSGQTGLEIARELSGLGAEVTLLMGPGRAKYNKKDWKNINIEQFFYYEELFNLIIEKLQTNKYDIIIHSSAVSDYRAKNTPNKKISSKKDLLRIDFKPTKKIIDYIKKSASKSFLVKFKLEVGVGKSLKNLAYKSLQNSNADLIVANDLDKISDTLHKAYIIDKYKNISEVSSKKDLCKKLGDTIFEQSVKSLTKK